MRAFNNEIIVYKGCPGGSDGKESACNAGDLGSIPGLGRFLWQRERQPTPVFLPEESHEPDGSDCKESACMPETQVQSLGQKDCLEKGMAPHSSILAWRIPWIEEPVGLKSKGWQRVGHN